MRMTVASVTLGIVILSASGCGGSVSATAGGSGLHARSSPHSSTAGFQADVGTGGHAGGSFGAGYGLQVRASGPAALVLAGIVLLGSLAHYLLQPMQSPPAQAANNDRGTTIMRVPAAHDAESHQQ